MTLLEIFGINFLVIFLFMTILWIVSLRMKNSSIVDVFWGTGFVIVVWAYFGLSSDGFLVRKLLIATLVTIWGLRLSIHIFTRNHGKPEDYRYQKFRKDAGKAWWWMSYFRVFLLQGVLLWIISAPLLTAQYHSMPDHLTLIDFLGASVWLIGFFFETIGDYQLSQFRANPKNKGKVLDIGVWRYTRHPNYFGDSTQWWGFFLIACVSGGWWTVFSPFIMTILLLRVSGMTLLEKTMEQRPGYKEYIERTSAFIPWFPQKKK